MAIAGPLEGLRAPLLMSAASTVMSLLLSSSPAWSQSVDVSALEVCAKLETAELKLSCFEAIVASSKDVAVEDISRLNSRAAASAATQAPAAPVAASTDVSETAVGPNPAASVPAPTVAEVPPTSPEADNPAEVANPPPRDDEFGLEYLVRQERGSAMDDELLHATVTEVSKGRHDILFFHLDNGQVWRQIEARHYAYPKNSEFAVTINRGMMGEYRLRIGDNGRMVRIRRVQ